jgi:PhoH-like ATPase
MTARPVASVGKSRAVLSSASDDDGVSHRDPRERNEQSNIARAAQKSAAWLSPSTRLWTYRRGADAISGRLGGDACTVTRRGANRRSSVLVIHPGQTRNGGAGRGSRTAPKKGSPVSSSSSRRTYVIDTSVLLSDPHAMRRFDEHDVVLPVVVISELEAKRHHNELGYFARTALRHLDDLRMIHRRLDSPVPVNNLGGTIRVELNHTDPAALPDGFRLGDNDSRILAVALNLAAEGCAVTLVSKDLPMRVKASAVGLKAEEYRAELAVETEWTGMSEIEVDGGDIDLLYEQGSVELDEARDLPCHTGVVLLSGSASALGRVMPSKEVKLIKADRDVFGIHGRSAEQRVALDLLLDPSIGIISLGGRAGTGKSALALCAGLESVLERQQHSKVVVFRPLYAVGGQELGYLPGTEGEKMAPWAQAVFDTLGALTTKVVIEEVLARGLLEVLPLTHIRGRSLHDAFVVVDEAQSLERNVLLTVLSRIGQGSRVVLTHDVAQRDNLRVGRHDGVVAVVEKLKGHPLFAHVTLTRSERSPIAALVTEMLEDVAV